MSAFIVDKRSVDVLVGAGAQVLRDEHPATQDHLNYLGQSLLDECVRSVSYRYPEDDLGELPGSYDEETIMEGIAPISVAQWLTPYEYTAGQELTREKVAEAISSYEYQSCEHPEWPESWAFKYCEGLKTVLQSFAPEPRPEPVQYESVNRNEAIKQIRAALKRRSGKAWSVTGGRGTGWGWIHITAPPKRRTGAHVQRPGAAFGEYEHIDTGQPQEFGLMTPQDCAELGELLGLDRPVHCQGHSIPASSEYYREYIDRAEGRSPVVHGTQYWD